MADVKKPASAYFMWFNAKREEIQKQLGTKNLGAVGKKAGEMWKLLPAAGKKPWETKAKEQKEAFEKFKATDAGKKALEQKKAERQEEKQARREKKGKKAARAIEKDDKLKKPASAYFLFANAKRDEVQKQLGTKDFGPVTRKIGEMWKALTDPARKPWEDKAKEQKDAYDKYIKSSEGMAVLQAYKSKVQEAKASFKVAEPTPETPSAAPLRKRRRTMRPAKTDAQAAIEAVTRMREARVGGVKRAADGSPEAKSAKTAKAGA